MTILGVLEELVLGVMRTGAERAGGFAVGLAAWYYDKFADWTYSGGEPGGSPSPKRTRCWTTYRSIGSPGLRDLGRAALLGEQRQQLQRR